jgi:hypothetical protein
MLGKLLSQTGGKGLRPMSANGIARCDEQSWKMPQSA